MSIPIYFLFCVSIACLTVNECFAGNTLGDIKFLYEVDTGYTRAESVIKNISINFTKQQIKTKVAHDLICSYVFRGLHYVRLTARLIEGGDEKVFKKIQNDDVYFFVGKVKSMFASLLNFNNTVDMDPIWWLYLYADYFKKAVEGKISYDKAVGKSWCSAVEDRLMHFLNDHKSKCDSSNSYNGDYTGSTFFGIIKNLNDDNVMINLQNLQLSLRQQLLKNEKFASVTNSRDDFDFERLAENRLIGNKGVMQCLTRDVARLVDWEKVSATIMKAYESSKKSAFGPHKYTGLSKYYKDFICLQKIIMLQIIKKHICYINAWSKNHNNDDEKDVNVFNVNEILLSHVNNFVQLLDIKEDDRFSVVTEYLFNPLNKLTDEKLNSKLLCQINDLITEYSLKLHNCRVTIPKIVNSDYANYSIVGTIEIANEIDLTTTKDPSYVNSIFFDSISSSEVYIQFLQRYLININFKVITSFNHFIKDFKTYMWLVVK